MFVALPSPSATHFTISFPSHSPLLYCPMRSPSRAHLSPSRAHLVCSLQKDPYTCCSFIRVRDSFDYSDGTPPNRPQPPKPISRMLKFWKVPCPCCHHIRPHALGGCPWSLKHMHLVHLIREQPKKKKPGRLARFRSKQFGKDDDEKRPSLVEKAEGWSVARTLKLLFELQKNPQSN